MNLLLFQHKIIIRLGVSYISSQIPKDLPSVSRLMAFNHPLILSGTVLSSKEAKREKLVF